MDRSTEEFLQRSRREESRARARREIAKRERESDVRAEIREVSWSIALRPSRSIDHLATAIDRRDALAREIAEVDTSKPARLDRLGRRALDIRDVALEKAARTPNADRQGIATERADIRDELARRDARLVEAGLSPAGAAVMDAYDLLHARKALHTAARRATGEQRELLVESIDTATRELHARFACGNTDPALRHVANEVARENQEKPHVPPQPPR